MSDRDKKPTHDVLLYDANDRYLRVGAAWPLRNADGFSVVLQAGVAIGNADGARIVIVKRKAKADGNR